MIAEIYPIKRMPRRFGVFDYEVPSGLELKRGQVVRIPFRFGEMLGVVARVKDAGPRGLKLKHVLGRTEVELAEAELDCLEAVAFDTAQSVSTVLHIAIPKSSSRPLSAISNYQSPITLPLTIPSREAPGIALTVAQMVQRRSAFVVMPDLKRFTVLLAAYLREKPDEPVMALFPNVRDAKLAGSRLSGFDPIVITGEEGAANRAAAWQDWRQRPAGLLVGTRLAALWTHPTLGAIFIARATHPNHKQADRNPRYDTRDVSAVLEDRLHAKLFLVDVCPRTDDLERFGSANILGPEARPRTTVVDMNVERVGAPHPCLGQTTAMRLSDTLAAGRRAICVYNLKGVSRRLQCADCGHRFPCPSCAGLLTPHEQTVRCRRCGHAGPIPLVCPVCRGKSLSPKGFGNRAVAAALQSMFPAHTVSAVEKGGESVASDTADILVVTRHYYENIFDPFDPPDVGLVTELDADLPLFEPSFRATEQALINAEEWRGVAHACRADFLLQSDAPDIFRAGLSDLRQSLSDDLKARQSYGRPPWRRTMTASYRTEESREAALALKALEGKIQSVSPRTDVESADGLRLSVPPDEIAKVLASFSSLDDRYIIDTNVQ